MFLPTSLTNRRKFLERMTLGAGSVLFLPGLLTSCADHRIPDPGSPGTIPPVVGAGNIDWNDDAKTVVTAGLGLIPEVGGILAALVKVFWPNTQVDVWDQVKERVESIVNQKVSDTVSQQVRDDLKGLNNSVLLYLSELKYGNAVSILAQWISTRNMFAAALPRFQSSGPSGDYRLPLLGLFAQFANMHLAILRDGVLNGKNWGRSDADQGQDYRNLQTAISDYEDYTLSVYNNGVNDVRQKAGNNSIDQCQPFKAVNEFTSQITLQVLDYMNAWKYFDINAYPKGAKVLLPREIYSPMIGPCDGYRLIHLPQSPPTKGPTKITVWGSEIVDGMSLTYPPADIFDGSGPDGVTTTARMGFNGWTKGSLQPPQGGILTISPGNPIVGASLQFGNYFLDPGDSYPNPALNAIMFTFLDRTSTRWTGTPSAQSSSVEVDAYPNHFVSNIIFGGSTTVLGFQYLNGGPPVTSRALGILYITSPKELSGADIAQAFPTYGIADALITDDLKVARQAHWASVKARADALK